MSTHRFIEKNKKCKKGGSEPSCLPHVVQRPLLTLRQHKVPSAAPRAPDLAPAAPPSMATSLVHAGLAGRSPTGKPAVLLRVFAHTDSAIGGPPTSSHGLVQPPPRPHPAFSSHVCVFLCSVRLPATTCAPQGQRLFLGSRLYPQVPGTVLGTYRVFANICGPAGVVTAPSLSLCAQRNSWRSCKASQI